MIRVVAVASLVSLLILVLYLPSAHPADRFLALLRAEHGAAAELWGDSPSMRILSKAMSLQESARDTSPVPPSTGEASSTAVDSAVAREMTSVNQRLFGNAYFRSIDALLLLASFRLALLLEWLPWVLAFTAAVLVDGYMARLVKAREFRQHDPEMFALFVCGAIVTACGAVVACVLPLAIHSMVMPCVPVVISFLLSRALASFHRRA